MEEHVSVNNPFLEQEIDLRRYFHVLYSKRWLIISFTVVICTLALLRVFLMRPVYQSTTRILIQHEAPKVVNMQEVAPEMYTGREYYQTQYKILKSRVLAERVNKELGEYEPWNEWSGRDAKRKKDAEPLTPDKRVNALLKRVEVNPIPNTQLVGVSVEDVDPALAAKIANLWAAEYISYILDTKFDASKYASTWLNEKIQEAREKLRKSEVDLQSYRKENRIVIDSEGQERSMFDSLLEKRAELEIELSEKLEYFKEKHPEIIGIRSELASIDNKINAEREKELETGEKEIKYNMLKREVAMNRDIYKSLLDRIGETEVMSELKTTNVRVVDKGITPKLPVKPRKKLSLFIAFFIGIMGGSGLAFLFESLDQSVKSPEDIKNHIKLPVLSSISISEGDKDKECDPEFISEKNPRSTISESYRSLRTSIMFTAVEHKRKTLIFTSAGPREGKTTTAINTAIVMANSGEKVLLIDADLRKPRIGKTFDINEKEGLTELLAEDRTFTEVVHHTGIDNLDVVVCGAIPPNPSELLGSSKMDKLLDELQGKYDRIILDTAPVLPVTDAVVLSCKVDGTVVVIKAGETHRAAILKAKEILTSVSASNLIGVVLNMVDTSKSGSYHYYYYYSKYKDYYGHGQEKRSRKKKVSG
jgi:capsular exopolysaccharide synthesis family protein